MLVEVFGPKGGRALYSKKRAEEVLKKPGFSTTPPKGTKKSPETKDEK